MRKSTDFPDWVNKEETRKKLGGKNAPYTYLSLSSSKEATSIFNSIFITLYASYRRMARIDRDIDKGSIEA